MDTKQPLSLFLVAILAASVFSVVGITSMPLQNVSAQAVTIETSVDELGGTFFGHGAVQVVIEDDDTDDDNDDTIDVDIDVEGDGGSFEIPNTSAGSQRFEFFLVHEDSDFNDAGALDGIASTPTIITFGGGNITNPELMFEDVSIDITYGSEDVTIDYEEAEADLQLDRDLYGSTSLLYVRIIDQDANNNPTESDAFTLNDTQLNDLLFETDGGEFEAGDYEFEETGDNTGVFELEASLDGDFDASDETVQMTLNDQAAYDTTLEDGAGGPIEIEDGDVNDSPDTAEFSFEIDNEDGEVDDVSDLTFNGELVATVRDHDQNIDSEAEDDIDGGLTVVVGDGAGGKDSESVDLTETDDNTGVFAIDLSNDELPITFLEDGGVTVPDNGILELRAEDIEEDIIIEYVDPLADDAADDDTSVVSFTVEMAVTPGQIAAPEEVGVTDEFTVTLTDQDLNDNPRTRDSYTVNITDASPFSLTRGGNAYSEIYTFEIEVDGEPIDFGAEVITTTLRETGANTGIFEMEIEVEDISDFGDEGADLELSDGDEIEVNINDFMADVDDPDEDSVSITIGKPSVGIDFDRTSPPIPPSPGSAAATDLGTGEVIVRLILVDPTLGTQTNVEEVVPFDFGTTAGNFTLEVDGDDIEDGIEVGAGDDLEDFDIVDGVGLEEVLEIGELEETGENTGVFESELIFTGNADMDDSDWQDAEFTFTYTNDEGDEESAGFTFRGNDGIVTVDQPSAKTGTVISITVEDQDLNFDTEEAESFDAQGTLLVIETEDETIEDIAGCGDISDETFEETGDNTGVFMAEFEVGDDIPVSCLDDDEVEVATNILVTFDDEIDSAGGGGDELELNIPVVSSTGSIQVSPDLVGPSTEITVLIVDADLDEDSASTDEYETPDGSSDDFFISFASSRNEVNEGSPDIEETGPNTGVFMFTLQLETDEDACEDDDMSDFEAEGGDTDSSIGACPGDLISVRYEDTTTGSGGSTTVSEVVEVRSWDPEFVADKESYNIGDRVTVTISDPDANTDPDIADSLTDIRVTSDSDRVGEEFSAIETGRDTGVFRLAFGTSSGTAGGAISVSQGDEVTIEYTDRFPADFVDEEEDKDFQFTVSIGGAGDIDSTTVTPPEPQDPTGQTLDEVSAGQQVVLSTSVRNNNAAPQDFVALIEVRDSSGITVYLAWQTGTLPANGQTQVGLSWTPEFTDDYTVRTFVISDLNNPRVLSEVSESEIVVS
jgi:hypothetical protein